MRTWGVILLALWVHAAAADHSGVRIGFGASASAIDLDDYNGASASGDAGMGVQLNVAYEFGNGFGAELGWIGADSFGLVGIANVLIPVYEVTVDDYSAMYLAPTYTWNPGNWYVRGKLGLADWKSELIVRENDDTTNVTVDGNDIVYSVEGGFNWKAMELGLFYSDVQSDPVSIDNFGFSLGFRF